MRAVCLYMTVLMQGISFGESPRWPDGRLRFSDWGLRRWLDAYVAQAGMFDGLARTLTRRRADDERSTCQLARSAGGALVARAAAAGLIRDDIGIADVLDIAAAIAWVGEQPERDAGQRGRLLRLIIDGLRPANAPI
ncbi:MAG: hypothetical protein QOC62_1953 [Mycobacterium sp.]|nr:hypothetical protein [Mycobacterium sp.]